MVSLNLFSFIGVSSFLFFIGLFGIVINKRSVILVLLCIELMLLGVNLNFVFFSYYLDDFFGQVFSLYILTVAAAESAIGLAILVAFYRVQSSLSINTINFLHG